MSMQEDTRKILDKWIPNQNKRLYKKVIKAFLLPIAYLKSKTKDKENLSEKIIVNNSNNEFENKENSNKICKTEKLNFITISMFNNTIYKNINKIPKDVDLIVGIPRSGLLVANLLALYLNIKLTDIDTQQIIN